MDPIVGLGGIGVASAAASGALAGAALCDYFRKCRRMRALLAVEGEPVASWIGWRLSKGVGWLRPVADWAMRWAPVARYGQWLRAAAEAREIRASEAVLLSDVLGIAGACVLLGGAISSSPVFGCAAAACLVVGLGNVGKGDAERRECQMRDEVPDALRSLGVCFRAGLSLMQTLRQTGLELKGPLGDVFLAAARTLETGDTTTEALALFEQRSRISELAFVAVALDVQHTSGGSLSAVLEAARESVEGEIELARSLRVQTAQAKLSARIVTFMPFGLIALFSLMSPGFLMPFFASFAGMALLAMALVMQGAGVMLVHRMLDMKAG